MKNFRTVERHMMSCNKSSKGWQMTRNEFWRCNIKKRTSSIMKTCKNGLTDYLLMIVKHMKNQKCIIKESFTWTTTYCYLFDTNFYGVFIWNSFTGLKKPPKMKLEDYFPDLPQPPPTGYFFFRQEKKNEIDEKIREEANGVTDRATVFKISAQVSKKMWDGQFSRVYQQILIFF